MKKIRGAEAVVSIEDDKVVKDRVEKGYRHESIDERLRSERTETETRLMEKADKYGANVPEILDVENSKIEMENIEGVLLKEKIESKPEIMEEVGENVARIHSAEIIHGDLTTSNIKISDGEAYLLDFGLSFSSDRIEDKAVDIHLLKQVLESSHPEVAEKGWNFFKEGYESYEKSGEVLDQLKEVEKRGRYK